MSDNTVQITDAQFSEEVLNSDVPVLVDFWAPWCGPCKMIAPVLEDIADDYEGKLKVVKLNVDDNQETAPKYNVRGIPTLLIIKNGEVVATKVGAVSKSQLAEFVESAM
ncbi:thioredoxin TrxA [Marinomonas sp. 2405UD68-3]|uniref:thioredoxin TrxA n=1 Tax=Marinomonas sp. 2405UD68-3 TaxID=3391835 RepID=UPI0039C93538